MTSTKLPQVAQAVVRRTQRDGSVSARDVREELARAGVEETHWKDVIGLAKPSLRYRRGRYYYVSPVVNRLRERVRLERHRLRELHRAVQRLFRWCEALTGHDDRREHVRIHFVQPVKVLTRTGEELNFVTKDLSLSGICLLGNRSLQGQTVRVVIGTDDPAEKPLCFLLRILWASEIGDGLFQQGGLFLGVGEVEENGHATKA